MLHNFEIRFPLQNWFAISTFCRAISRLHKFTNCTDHIYPIAWLHHQECLIFVVLLCGLYVCVKSPCRQKMRWTHQKMLTSRTPLLFSTLPLTATLQRSQTSLRLTAPRGWFIASPSTMKACITPSRCKWWPPTLVSSLSQPLQPFTWQSRWVFMAQRLATAAIVSEKLKQNYMDQVMLIYSIFSRTIIRVIVLEHIIILEIFSIVNNSWLKETVKLKTRKFNLKEFSLQRICTGLLKPWIIDYNENLMHENK